MPLTLSSTIPLVTNATLQGRVAVGFYLIAREVFVESPSAPGHENRVQYARSIIMQDYKEFLKLTALVLTDGLIMEATPATQTDITDDMILNSIRSMWNRLSGVPR